MKILAERHVVTLFQPPSWISDFLFYLAVLHLAVLTAPLKSFTTKTWGSTADLCFYHVR